MHSARSLLEEREELLPSCLVTSSLLSSPYNERLSSEGGQTDRALPRKQRNEDEKSKERTLKGKEESREQTVGRAAAVEKKRGNVRVESLPDYIHDMEPRVS